MKLKRIAMVAAAAVVGPTVLMATPAMADEVRNPAVTTPDAAPKDDIAPATGETPQAPQAPEVPEASKPEGGQQPAAPEAQPKPQPNPADTVTSGGAGKTGQKAAAAPQLTLDGLPKEFTSGAGWSEFSLHVDNSGRPAVDDYSLELVLWTLDTFGWEAGDIRTEVYAPDSKGAWGWHAIAPDGSEEVYSLSLADVDIETNEVFDLKLRMKFGKDTPPSRFSLSTTAEGGTADRVRYESTVTAPDEQEQNNGPKVALQGLPAGGFKAGGAWQPFSLGVDNSGKEKIDNYGFSVFFDNNSETLKSKHLAIEVWDGERWVDAKNDSTSQVAWTIIDRAVGKDAKFDIQLRAKFTEDAPVGPIFIVVLADDHEADGITSDVAFAHSSITAPGTGSGTGDGGTTGNQPKPEGHSTPIKDTTPVATGGQLAETGTDAATSWALGGAGVALAMGAALVAGTGRRRRPTA
ncbi:hypothetical protein PV721_32915 [Streptomyces sp. MB09-01]|uniref:hypothetical protein n=1 Tax=Streptomyces sp. MB09-01 TaxID=3028666 RepID=UPI0029B6451D|nr:hypothetical protein [Streptomyces sp. MB09-01]MDX3539049.1 hypothetical protein [Streptomyces sp. MB09-01]